MRLVNNKIKKITDHNHIVFTSNCTTAIFLLLKALKFKKKKIIIPVNICFDVILSIFYSGNIPLIIDTNKNLGLSYSDLKKKINNSINIGAIIFPYLYGNSDNFLKVYEYIKNKKILLIEDIAGAFGGKKKNILDLLEIILLEVLAKVRLLICREEVLFLRMMRIFVQR